MRIGRYRYIYVYIDIYGNEEEAEDSTHSLAGCCILSSSSSSSPALALIPRALTLRRSSLSLHSAVTASSGGSRKCLGGRTAMCVSQCAVSLLILTSRLEKGRLSSSKRRTTGCSAGGRCWLCRSGHRTIRPRCDLACEATKDTSGGRHWLWRRGQWSRPRCNFSGCTSSNVAGIWHLLWRPSVGFCRMSLFHCG